MANSRKRVRRSLVTDFDSLEGKNVFKRRLDHVRKVLTPAGQYDLDNYGLMSAIFDFAMYNSVQQYKLLSIIINRVVEITRVCTYYNCYRCFAWVVQVGIATI